MLFKYFRVFIVLILISQAAFAQKPTQKGTLKGVITDLVTKETMVGVNVIIDNAVTGTVTDVNGEYTLQIKPGRHKVTYKFVGYSDRVKFFSLKPGEEMIEDVKMKPESKELDAVVVTAGKFEQKISDVTVSINVIKPSVIENNNTTDIKTAINKIPGVNIIEDQPNIRGGTGWSFGAGSRVLLLVDDLPLIAVGAGDTKFHFLPVENISQLEVIKGASSAMFGSSALNGVINIRTAYPGIQPVTKFSIFSGFYMNPRRSELKWWGNQPPLFTGTSFLHSRKIGKLDLVTGANVLVDAGYRENNNDQRFRYNLNLRYKLGKKDGLYVGINSNIQWVNRKGFFIWIDKDAGAYRQPANSINEFSGWRITVDPYIEYFGKNGGKQSLKFRYYRNTNDTKNVSQSNASHTLYGQYNYHKVLWKNTNVSLGTSVLWGISEARLFGTHTSMNTSLYAQLDQKFLNKISLSFGIRGEGFMIDDEPLKLTPVIRSGVNIELAKYTFLRASFGQGYRYPSIAEKYTRTVIDIVNIFPNPDIQPEKGWSAELGLRQGIQVGRLNGFLDVAGFWMEYQNMMEFTFNNYDTVTFKPSMAAGSKPGFQSQNISNARILGVDVMLLAQGKLSSLNLAFGLGYTYSHPVALGNDSAYNLSKTSSDPILKYRFYHSFKANVEVSYKGFSTGLDFDYSSNMVNIDKIFESGLILKGLKEYREEHNKGNINLDWRVSYQFTVESKVSIIVKNLLNNENMGRPGDIAAPRNIALQYSLSF